MSLTSDHLERFLDRIRMLDHCLNELALTSVDPAMIAPFLKMPELTLPITDHLTGLPNRKVIVGLAEREFRLMVACSTPLTLIVFDVDGMKEINNRITLLGGDAVLKQLCGLLASTLRPGEFVGRFGGDRFLIVAPSWNADQAVALAERINNTVRQGSFTYEGMEIKITVSLGFAGADDSATYPPAKYDFPEGGVSDELLPMIMAATEKMDEAKRGLRTIQTTQAELRKRLMERLAAENDECYPDHVFFSGSDAVVDVAPSQDPTIEITHVLRYRYDAPIRLGPQIVRLLPAPSCRSRILSYDIQFIPKEGATWRNTWDQVGNDVIQYSVAHETSVFEVHTRLTANLSPFDPFCFVLDHHARQYPFAYQKAEAEQLAAYLYAAPAGPLLRQFLANLPSHSDYTVDFLVHLNKQIHNAIKYEPRHEQGVWHPEETLANQKGASRDIAYLLVEVLRQKNLAARFVSGYFIHPSDTNDQWEVRFHAWAEVFLPGRGWLGLDPTACLVACESHIPLAYGTLPQDANAIEGQFVGIANISAEFEMKACVSTSQGGSVVVGMVSGPYEEAKTMLGRRIVCLYAETHGVVVWNDPNFWASVKVLWDGETEPRMFLLAYWQDPHLQWQYELTYRDE